MAHTEAYMAEAAKRTQDLLHVYSAIDPALAAFAAAKNLLLANRHSAVPRVITDPAYSGTIHREVVIAPTNNTHYQRFRADGCVWYDEQMEGGSRELQPRRRHAKLIPFGVWDFDAGNLEGLVELLSHARGIVFREWTEEEIAGT